MTGRRFEADSSVEPTFTGYIETTLDALLIFEACRQRMVPKISRRLHDKERHIITSGSVFVFQETEAGIKRWTDGFVWSPSRILGNFLIYRELNKKTNPNSPSFQEEQLPPEPPKQNVMMTGPADIEAAAARRQKERALVGSLTGSTKYKEGGLIKKTISLAGLHMISYYDVQDVLDGKLRTPSSLPELSALEPSPEFLAIKAFRQPPVIEIGPDGVPRYRAENAGTEQTHSQPVQPQYHQQHHHPLPVPHHSHMMPVPQRGPVPVPHHMPGPRMPPLQLPVPHIGGNVSPPPHSTTSGPGSAGSTHSSTGGYISPGHERANPMLSAPSAGGPSRSKSPIEADASRPGFARSQSSGSPNSKQGPLSANATGRFDPYSQQGRRTVSGEQRPHTSAGDMHEQAGYDSGYPRPAFAASMPPSMGHDERYAYAYPYHHAPSMYTHQDHRPTYIPGAHLPVPIPYAHPGGYEAHHHHGSYPPPPVGRRSGSYESDSNFAFRPESPQTSRSNGVAHQHYGAPPTVKAAPRSADDEHVHPASAPATQTNFSSEVYHGRHQASGLVASSSPDLEDQYFERH